MASKHRNKVRTAMAIRSGGSWMRCRAHATKCTSKAQIPACLLLAWNVLGAACPIYSRQLATARMQIRFLRILESDMAAEGGAETLKHILAPSSCGPTETRLISGLYVFLLL